MKDQFIRLFQLFQGASIATRITLVIGTFVVVAIAGVSSWFANRPDEVQLWGNLTSAEAAEYKNALAQGGIAFRSSPPPENGIWVDSSDRYSAEAQVAMAGYRPVQKGIQLMDGGAASAFLSSTARAQMADKREWQECELQLERLFFVERAAVTSSGANQSPFGGAKLPTISVTLGLRAGVLLDDNLARTVAALVRGRFNVPMENITIVDERGNLLHDGMGSAVGMSTTDLFSHKRRYDSDIERRTNKALEDAYGRGVASVIVNSDWELKHSETITEKATPSTAKYYESTSKSESSSPTSHVGGAAGISSNITEQLGVESAAVPSGESSGGTNKSENTESRSVVGRETAHTIERTPVITRLSVALLVDESQAAKLTEISKVVKAAVGYDESRGDQFEAIATPLASIERDDEGNPVIPELPEPAAAPNQYVELLLEHGVELLAMLGFLFILMKSLKGATNMKSTIQVVASPGGVTRPTASRPTGLSQDEVESLDLDALARAQVEELVRADPEKVSEILAQWAKSRRGVVGAGK